MAKHTVLLSIIFFTVVRNIRAENSGVDCDDNSGDSGSDSGSGCESNESGETLAPTFAPIASPATQVTLSPTSKNTSPTSQTPLPETTSTAITPEAESTLIPMIEVGFEEFYIYLQSIGKIEEFATEIKNQIRRACLLLNPPIEIKNDGMVVTVKSNPMIVEVYFVNDVNPITFKETPLISELLLNTSNLRYVTVDGIDYAILTATAKAKTPPFTTTPSSVDDENDVSMSLILGLSIGIPILIFLILGILVMVYVVNQSKPRRNVVSPDQDALEQLEDDHSTIAPLDDFQGKPMNKLAESQAFEPKSHPQRVPSIEIKMDTNTTDG